jgi:hypothetical protein
MQWRTLSVADAFQEIQRTTVNDCQLRFLENDDGRQEFFLPVSKFDLTFELDTIPVAQVVPALGRNILTGTRTLFSSVKERDPVQLIISIDGTNRLLLDGFVSSQSGSDNNTPFNKKLSAVITIKHRAILLAGAPTVSFVYAADGTQNLLALEQRNFFKSIFGITRQEDKNNGVSITNSMLLDIVNHSSIDNVFWPGFLLKLVATNLMTEFSGRLTEEELDELMRDYDPANLTRIVPTPSAFLHSFFRKFEKDWTGKNTWEALVSTANYLFMHIVPFNNGFYFANPISLLREPDIVIRSSEFISIAPAKTDDLKEPVNGVILRLPIVKELEQMYVTYPDKLLEEGGGKPLPKDEYYHFRDIPDWMHPIIRYMYGPPCPVNQKEKKSAKPTPWDPGGVANAETVEDYYRSVGSEIAKVIYSELKQTKAAVQFIFPYREDLMPGTTVKIEQVGVEDMSFLGNTLHGMIAKTRISCDMTGEKSRLNTYIDMVSVRNADDNADDRLTFEDHPIYEGRWTAIDVFGEILDGLEIPDSQKPQERPQQAAVNGRRVERDNIRDFADPEDIDFFLNTV